MKPALPVALVVAVLLVAGLVVAQPATRADAAAAPTHTLTVAGPGAAMYPRFDPAIERYAITSPSGAPTVTVKAASSEPGSVVRINGAPAPGGTRTLTGLEPGDEISVLITDSTGTAVHSLFVTPAGFPTLERQDDGSATTAVPPGHILLTLSTWTGGAPFYETAVDANGVPVLARRTSSSMDFKRQPDGTLTVSRGTTTPGRTGSDLALLDERLAEVGRRETAGLVDTDGHDSILLDDGSVYLLAYEPNPATGLTDSVIQHLSATGDLLWEWSTADHVDPSTETVIDIASNPDYAHINSIEIMPDGDVLASFRHFSSVFKIARHSHDGHARGDVVWRLGGRHSDFTFVDENGEPVPGDGGPCAQHTASVVSGGRILLFDNGSWDYNDSELCVDPADPSGPLLARPQTRVTEYALDVDAGTATTAWSYEEPGRFALFAGSSERLSNGNTLIGWASSRLAVATEVDATGTKVWELIDATTADPNARQFTYRAARATVDDALRPEIAVSGFTSGASYAEGARLTPTYSCTDRGGSSLRSCTVAGLDGTRLDTRTPGTRQVRVTATDGAGNSTTVARSYVVRPTAAAVPQVRRPDVAVRAAGTATYRGVGTIGSARAQTVAGTIRRRGASRTFVVRITNRGNRAERFTVEGTKGTKRFPAKYRVAGANRTTKIVRGAYRTPVLLPGRSITLKIVVRRSASTPAGARRTFKIRATSTAQASARDTVAAVVRAKARRAPNPARLESAG
ncbi:aryl-sulfate sulfotransferase [Mumia qirimensis]|uniref:aryl-sulfate sulfotransferase n=1 Tax=Mumia qirimensis TaxID=3234852 RepID=UPI00351CEF91